MAPPQEYNPQIPPPYFPHYPPTNSPSVDSNESMLARIVNRQIDMAERQESMTRREKKENSAERNMRNVKRGKQTRGHASTRLLKK